MYKLKILLMILILGSITACQATRLAIATIRSNNTPQHQEYQRTVNRWVGKSESKLVALWGKPNRTFFDKGVKNIVYESHTPKGPYCNPFDEFKRRCVAKNGLCLPLSKGDELLCRQRTMKHVHYDVWCAYEFEIQNQVIVAGKGWGANCAVTRE